MSIYEILTGTHPIGYLFFKVLGKEPEEFGRVRDIYVTFDRDLQRRVIVVMTRNGGSNREEHMPKDIETWPGFIKVEELEQNNTYAYLIFEIPLEYRDLMQSFPLKRAEDALEIWSGAETQLLLALQKNGVEVKTATKPDEEGYAIFGLEPPFQRTDMQKQKPH